MSGFRKVVMILLFTLLLTLSFADDWPHWRGPDYDGISKETDIDSLALNNPVIVWEAKIGTGFSAVSMADGKVYTMGNINKDTDVVYCFDALTSEEVWTFPYSEPLTPKYYEGGSSATPTIIEGKVYTLSRTGKVFCLDAATGEKVWGRDLPYKSPTWGFSGSPVIVDDLVILNVGAAGVALNKNDGKIVWKSDNVVAGYATPVPFEKNGTKYVAVFSSKTLEIIESLTGKAVMTFPWETKYDTNAADPIISGDEIFITSGYGHGAALLKITTEGLQEVWQNKNMRSQMSGPVLINGYLYGIDADQLACVEWKTGQQMWSEKAPKNGALCAAGDKLIVMGETGTLFIVQASPESYQELSSAKVLSHRCWTMPTVANGKLYVRNTIKNDLDRLVCVDVQNKKTPAATSAVLPTEENNWPQWQGPRRDNVSTEIGLLKQWPEGGPKMLWSVDGLGDGFSSVSIANGKIYTTGMIDKEGFLFCFDLNGQQLWKQSYGDEWFRSFPSARCTPTIQDGKVYIISGFGKTVCFEADTGKQVWEADPVEEFEGKYSVWGIAQSLLIVDDKVIVVTGGPKAMVVALDVVDGKVLWTTSGNGEQYSYCSPTAFEWGGKKIIVGATDFSIFGVDASDGSVLWIYPMSDYMTAKIQDAHPNTPYFEDGLIFFTSGYDMGSVKLKLSPDGTSVEKVWANLAFDTHHGGFVVVDGYIYGPTWEGNKNGKWSCVNWGTGQTVYEQQWINKGSITYADGMLYCYEESEGTMGLVKADPAGFEVVSSFKITKGQKEHWAHPVICGKRLYIRHGDVLMAYDIGEKS